ncbi:MAG TPA: DUF2339 domain-containing protein [Gemmatimonadaceae bacterium]|nr:DUF2339 domain-containing protein [Gemmatimonadaceae bacterium]
MTREPDPEETPTLDARLARVERSIAMLSAEVAAIRGELSGAARPESASLMHTARSMPGRQPSGPSAPPRRAPRRYLGESVDFERLLGRYGMLGIAVLAAAAAVGTFLSWAISHGYLTLPPIARIVVGLLFAAAIAAWGFRLRRAERSFGSSLLGLSLVIVLVCAYAAGPGLAVVPEWFAFAGAIAVSWALAIFARSEDDEPLWCVAFGGAAIAPFVTSSGKGNVYGLAAYGASVLIASCFAIGHRAWAVAWRVFYAAAALLVATTVIVSRRYVLPGFLVAFTLPLVVATCGVLPFAPDSRKRAALRWLGALVAIAAWRSPSAATTAGTVASALLVGVALWLAIVDWLGVIEQSSLFVANRGRISLLDWIDAAFIPLALCFRAGGVIEPAASPWVAYGIGAGIFLWFAWRRPIGALRDAAVAGFLVLMFGALLDMGLEQPVGRVLAWLALALVALALHRERPTITWVVGAGFILLAAGGVTAFALVARRPYAYSPFATEASLAALCVTIALALIVRYRGLLADATESVLPPPSGAIAESERELRRRIVIVSPWAWTFLWCYLELSMAFSRSTSTLLLVVYFAATAVAGVAVGHVRQSPGTRKVGLALALLAAATAVYGATSYFVVGVRVLAYLVTSAFLLGIAYWYRRPGQVQDVSS